MRSIICTEQPMTRDSMNTGMPAASASVAKPWRRWYGPRLRDPAASSAGYHSRVRQLSSLICPPRSAREQQRRVEPHRQRARAPRRPLE